jgi:hypothetical protein
LKQRSILALQLEGTYRARAKVNQRVFKGNQYESGTCQNSDKYQIDTKKELAKIAGG